MYRLSFLAASRPYYPTGQLAVYVSSNDGSGTKELFEFPLLISNFQIFTYTFRHAAQVSSAILSFAQTSEVGDATIFIDEIKIEFISGPCGPGQYSTAQQITCEACQSGRYQVLSGSTSCSDCGAASRSPPGASVCSSTCPPGYVPSQSSACTACTAGTYASSGASECSSCTPGYYTANAAASNCFSCLSGFFQTSTGSASCDSCIPGYFSSSANAVSCSPCWAGTYTRLTASNMCSACAAGMYSDQAASLCSVCGIGKFQASSSQISCLDCPTFALSESQCVSQCPAGYSQSVTSRTCTVCAPGTYASASSSSCQSCNPGQFSNTGASACTGVVHEWDFRGCTTGAIVSDTYWPSMGLVVTPFRTPQCSSAGISFNGANQYAQITSWNWGGSTSIEFSALFSDFLICVNSRVFDFGSGSPSDNVGFYSLWYPFAAASVDSKRNYK